MGLRYRDGKWHRLIKAMHLSRPEDYLSVYQSCCNHNCQMCHSWHFSRRPAGEWLSPEEILGHILNYRDQVTVWEPRGRATMWHAEDLCVHCGNCALMGRRGPLCPRRLSSQQVVLSPQGFGPARNIVSFTGGDLYCRTEFYVRMFELIKEHCSRMWVKIETNGYGLTPKGLEELAAAGLDSVWLDLKAHDPHVYKRLCGTTNEWVLRLPERILEHDVVLEIVLIYIPAWVELSEVRSFGHLIADVDPGIPVTLLAFFPEYRLSGVRAPTVDEMLDAHRALLEEGLTRVRLGNYHIFCRDKEEYVAVVRAVEGSIRC